MQRKHARVRICDELDGEWMPRQWTSEGYFKSDGFDQLCDLVINAKPLVYERWVHVYEGGQSVEYRVESDSKSHLYGIPVAKIHVRKEYYEGEGFE